MHFAIDAHQTSLRFFVNTINKHSWINLLNAVSVYKIATNVATMYTAICNALFCTRTVFIFTLCVLANPPAVFDINTKRLELTRAMKRDVQRDDSLHR